MGFESGPCRLNEAQARIDTVCARVRVRRVGDEQPGGYSGALGHAARTAPYTCNTNVGGRNARADVTATARSRLAGIDADLYSRVRCNRRRRIPPSAWARRFWLFDRRQRSFMTALAVSKHTLWQPNSGIHCEEGEYSAFLERLPIAPSFRRARLRYRAAFIERWPDLGNWFSTPLPERIGCLYGDKQAFPSCPLSFNARTYLYYLSLTDHMLLDYPFLFAVGNMRVSESTEPHGLDFGMAGLINDGIRLGYRGLSLRGQLVSLLPRIAMHTGIRSPDDLTQEHLTELYNEVVRYTDRDDLHRYHPTGKTFPLYFIKSWHQRIRQLQLLLYHRGCDVVLPRMTPDKRRVLPSARPDLQCWVDRWIAAKRKTLAAKTVDHMAVSLRHFIRFLAQLKPRIRNFADIDSTQITAFLNGMKHETAVKTGAPLSISAQRARAGAVAQFLADAGCWGWPDFPSRPVLDPKDLPRLPHRVPRFIPEAELARLLEEIRNLPCPLQRAALLTARWSGARRGEIARLAVDCLDRYPDGTARLRIPAGKTLRERMVPLHEEAAGALLAVIEMRKKNGDRPVVDERTGERVRFLFYRRGVRISADYLFQYGLNAACKRAGLVDGRGRATISHIAFVILSELSSQSAAQSCIRL